MPPAEFDAANPDRQRFPIPYPPFLRHFASLYCASNTLGRASQISRYDIRNSRPPISRHFRALYYLNDAQDRASVDR